MSEMKSIDLGLKTAYDELFMNDAERTESKLPRIYDIPIAEIDPFPDHPFQVRMNEDMDQLVESIKERGLITPITVRKKDDGRYEIVSGHRRTKACELAGLPTVKAEIKELNRDEAIILMVESNLQRSVILPSEKAKSYKMRLDAMKRQAGRPAKENVSQLETHLRSSEILAQSSPDSRAQIDRYIRLNELITPVLDMVDEGKIAFRPAVELSYLSVPEQQNLMEVMELEMATPSLPQAIRMKELSREGKLDGIKIYSIMQQEKPNQREKYTFRADTLRQYLPDNITREQTENYVLKALEYYKHYLERQKGQER